MMKIANSIPDLHFRTKVLHNFNPLFTGTGTRNSLFLPRSSTLFFSFFFRKTRSPRPLSIPEKRKEKQKQSDGERERERRVEKGSRNAASSISFQFIKRQRPWTVLNLDRMCPAHYPLFLTPFSPLRFGLVSQVGFYPRIISPSRTSLRKFPLSPLLRAVILLVRTHAMEINFSQSYIVIRCVARKGGHVELLVSEIH